MTLRLAGPESASNCPASSKHERSLTQHLVDSKPAGRASRLGLAILAGVVLALLTYSAAGPWF